MKLTLTIQMDNAAFEDMPGVEVSRILHKAADWLSDCNASDAITLFDINGNKVGAARITGKRKDDGTNGQDRESYSDTQDRESYRPGR